ncbi:hypothetical protein IWX47DRAFT_907947 [Phyllosticta citricarpa]
MAHLFVQQQQGEPIASPLHSMIENRQPRSQNHMTRDASREIQMLDQLPAKVLGFERVDAVVTATGNRNHVGLSHRGNNRRCYTLITTPTKKKTGNEEKLIELGLANI